MVSRTSFDFSAMVTLTLEPMRGAVDVQIHDRTKPARRSRIALPKRR
jgi:hypothetical protein